MGQSTPDAQLCKHCQRYEIWMANQITKSFLFLKYMKKSWKKKYIVQIYGV